MENYLYNYEAEIDAIIHDYERFVLQTHKFPHLGLFRQGSAIFIVIENVSDSDVEMLSKDYNDNYRAICNPAPLIVPCIRDGFEKVELRESWRKINQHGYPYTYAEIENELYMMLPKRFQPFRFDYKMVTGKFNLELEVLPSADDVLEIEIILADLGLDNYELVINVNPNLKKDIVSHAIREKELIGDIDFLPHNLIIKASGLIDREMPKIILDKYEEDEEFWVDQRLNILRETSFNQSDISQLEDLNNGSLCFIDATHHDRGNLRTYLSLYRTVIISLPQKTSSTRKSFFEMFEINEFELRVLIEHGRLKFSVIDNIELYPLDLIAYILDVDPKAVIFPRSITASCLLSMRDRTGLLGFSYTTDEQFRFLNSLHLSNSKSASEIAGALANSWNGMERMVNQNGLLLIGHLGIGGLISKMYFGEKGSDIPFFSSSYEISQGLGAHYFPYESENESRYAKAAELVGSIYHGINMHAPQIKENKLKELLSSIYAINNDMSILELDRVFSHKEIPFATDILNDLSKLSEEEVNYKILQLKDSINKLEKNQQRLSALDFSGLIGGVASMYSGEPVVSLLVWGLTATNRYVNLTQGDTELFARLVAINNRVSKDVVLIKNARNKISNIM
ncbi:hypothetical protein PEKONANI_02791 [Aeromonas jandaei]|uniref:hypothetical protein n=1 Tax=Aeromonas jandaei TaxID=650 RepID=UPI00366AFC00